MQVPSSYESTDSSPLTDDLQPPLNDLQTSLDDAQLKSFIGESDLQYYADNEIDKPNINIADGREYDDIADQWLANSLNSQMDPSTDLSRPIKSVDENLFSNLDLYSYYDTPKSPIVYDPSFQERMLSEWKKRRQV